ncbi:MAG: riboflavin biosynthesis protein RibF [Candidatus Latescibacterota bacterium]|nr:MAG: riboflavin biosynthesis protein RibF [Candidatus Latescibacterota bacterium]
MPRPRIARSIEEIKSISPRNSAVTLGVFDGVHLGHERIINELIRTRRQEAIDGCYLITFDPHPLVVTHSRMMPPMLTTIEERLALISRYELDGILVLKFDEELANVDYRVFLERYLVKPFDLKHLVLGYDCHFGKNREGSPERVMRESSKLGFAMKIVHAVRQGDEVVSSTKIRNALIEGDIEKANALLGHPYVISGRVVRGHGKGRGLGFPTANLLINDPYKLWPPRGVYAVRVEAGGRKLDGMMNVGRAPTMKSLPEETREAEVHIFNLDEDLYDKHLTVYCHSYLRRERRFESPEELARQLQTDRVEAGRRLDTDTESEIEPSSSRARREKRSSVGRRKR